MGHTVLLGAIVLEGLDLAIDPTRQRLRRAAERRVQERLDRDRDPQWWEERQAHRAHEAQLVEEELARMRRATWVGHLLARGRRTDETPA
jgi:hypothetical protein